MIALKMQLSWFDSNGVSFIMVSGSAWCGRLTVTQEKGNTESDGFNSRRDRKLKLNASVAELVKAAAS